MVKPNWSDGAVLTVVIGPLDGGVTRIASARLALTDDRSFLAEAHRDLVEMLPNLSINPGQVPGHGWIRVGVGAASRELNVLLRPLPVGIDLVLGQCAKELLTASGAGATA